MNTNSSANKVHLPIYEAEQTGEVTDLFRCHPYKATIRVEVCLKRQLRAVEQTGKITGSNARATGDYENCRGCVIGRVLRDKFKDVVVETKPLGRTRFIAPKRTAK